MNNRIESIKLDKNILLKDIVWYLIGTAIPLFVGLLKSPIYTRVFSPAEYGAYSLVFISFNYLSLICHSWIISCAWRFYHQYKEKGQIDRLFSNLIFLYVLFSLGMLLVACTWFLLTKMLIVKKLILWCLLQFCFSEISSLLFIKHRLEGDVFYYNVFQSVRVVVAFGLLYLFTSFFNWGIESFLISDVVVNVVMLVIVSFTVKLNLSLKQINKNDLLSFFDYGKIGLVINVCSVLLISLDRFIIKYFAGLTEVGIYNQNYNIAQISIAILINVYWSALNPYLLPILEFRPLNMRQKLGNFFKIYVVAFTPICFYFFLYARFIAEIMLGEKFQCGYKIIYWVAMSEFIKGLYFIGMTNLKFKNKLGVITFLYFISLIVNVLLNLLLIPHHGYQIAACAAFFANLILFFCLCLKDDSVDYNCLFVDKRVFMPFGVLMLHLICHLISIQFVDSFVYYLLEGLIWFAFYCIMVLKCTDVLKLLHGNDEVKDC